MVSGGIHLFVIPAQAGIYCFMLFIVLDIQAQGAARTQWIPACAEMATAPPVPRVHDIMVFLGLLLPAAHPYHHAVLHLVHQLVFLIPRGLVQKN